MLVASGFLSNLRVLLQNTGSDVVYTRPPASVYNPATGGTTEVPGTGLAVEARGAFVQYASNMIDGTLVLAGDRKFLTTSDLLSIEPQPFDLIDGEGGQVQVINVYRVAPNNTQVGYILQVRGAGAADAFNSGETGGTGGTGS